MKSRYIISKILKPILEYKRGHNKRDLVEQEHEETEQKRKEALKGYLENFEDIYLTVSCTFEKSITPSVITDYMRDFFVSHWNELPNYKIEAKRDYRTKTKHLLQRFIESNLHKYQ